MPEYRFWDFPDLPTEVAELLLQNDQKLVIIGVIGKSAFSDCNKMVAFNVLDRHPSLIPHEPKEGQIQFYYKPKESMLFLHFETTYDAACMQKMLERELAEKSYDQFLLFNQRVKSRFARMLLLAIHVCHIIVFVELNVNFDASLLALFKAMKIIRDRHVVKFLPKLIKNTATGTALGKHARLCSPRFLFLFENYPDGYEKSKEAISKLEFEVEDNIYKMLRNEHIVTSKSSLSLFSIPGNKRFVYFNTNDKLREDPLLKSVDHLKELIIKPNVISDDDDLEDLRPYRGFGIPLIRCKAQANVSNEEDTFLEKRQFMDLIKEHVNEALTVGFDDNLTRYKSKTHFMVLPAKAWFEVFKMLHKIFIENPDSPDFEANDSDYKAYLENFDKILNVDNEFFIKCCDIGLQKAFAMYNNPKLTHYSAAVHKKLVGEAVTVYMKYARGPFKADNESKLREMCESCWENGKQQCEYPSLRGYPCMLPKHIVQDPTEHSSGNVFISTCNCGRTQGRREDPYTIRQANYEFYEFMSSNCNLCMKVKKIHFAIFQPSSSDYRAAEFKIAFPKLGSPDSSTKPSGSVVISQGDDDADLPASSQPLTASQGTMTNLSLESINELDKIEYENNENSSDEETVNELILQLKDEAEPENQNGIHRQASTTEYLRGMVHTETPPGLLPQFPSWSLCNVGSSSIYSHNTGLLEHYQSGYLSGANFLLPWDVQVRLEHSESWAYEKTRYRKMGEVFVLKIFVGFEYECPRGHRFMMSAPDKILRGASGILRDSGSKVVFNNMPLYFNCPCRAEKPYVAQLMRVHVVTPKAPVNVIVDPKIHTGNEHAYEFTLGLPSPPKLTQSAYWILRLPYIYQGDDGPIAPPIELDTANAMTYGYLKAGMFGVSETELDE